jgi:hypothetical protein
MRPRSPSPAADLPPRAISSASLSPDGGTFHAAAWEGSPLQVYSTRSESPESLPLPYLNALVASISSKGELAIIANRVGITGYARPGTLARAPMSGGAARDVMENVQHADWLPDGSNLVVSHVVDGKYRLEFPIGKVVYETTGWISHVAVSPDGQRVAFQDQPIVGDDRGGIAIIDASGARQSMPVVRGTQGIAWSPPAEVWFVRVTRSVASPAGDDARRQCARCFEPGSLFLGDIGADGTVLLARQRAGGVGRRQARRRSATCRGSTGRSR